MADVLPWIFSQGDRLKRQMGGLLADPIGTFQQTAGLIQDNHRELQGLLDRAPTDRKAQEQATGMVMNGLLGFAPVGMMAGVGAKTANKAMLEKAQALEKQGAKPDAIWQQTGWGKAPDGKWRFEIDDSAVPVKMRLDEDKLFQYPHVQEALPHKELMAAYPALKGTRLVPAFNGGGSWDRAQNAVGVQPIRQGDFTPAASGEAKRTILHELQHAVQDVESFAKGGSYKSPEVMEAATRTYDDGIKDFLGDPQQLMRMAQDNAYRRLAGEAESRLVESRVNMTPAERAAQFPWDAGYFRKATGVPLDSLIFR